jgi:hypothetical protein
MFFSGKEGSLPERIWEFWNLKIKLNLIFLIGGRKSAIYKPQGITIPELLSYAAENETQLKLLELLMMMYGKLYKHMYLILNPALDLEEISLDFQISDRLWWLQTLCQSEQLIDENPACLYYQMSFGAQSCNCGNSFRIKMRNTWILKLERKLLRRYAGSWVSIVGRSIIWMFAFWEN